MIKTIVEDTFEIELLKFVNTHDIITSKVR